MGRPRKVVDVPNNDGGPGSVVAFTDPSPDSPAKEYLPIRNLRELGTRASLKFPFHATAEEIVQKLMEVGSPEVEPIEIEWEINGNVVRAVDHAGWFSTEMNLDGKWTYTRYAPNNLHNRPHNPRSPQDIVIEGSDLDGFIDILCGFRDAADSMLNNIAGSLRKLKDEEDAITAKDSYVNEHGPAEVPKEDLLIISECHRLGGGVRNLTGAIVFMASAYGIAVKNDDSDEGPLIEHGVPGIRSALVEPDRHVLAIKADVLEAIEKDRL